MDPLEQRIRREQEQARARAGQKLALLPEAAGVLHGMGAERIWLFGSLAEDRPHLQSDVDLLVRGLPAEKRADAWWALEELFGAQVDLVRDEDASPAVRRRAMEHGMEITAPSRISTGWGERQEAENSSTSTAPRERQDVESSSTSTAPRKRQDVESSSTSTPPHEREDHDVTC